MSAVFIFFSCWSSKLWIRIGFGFNESGSTALACTSPFHLFYLGTVIRYGTVPSGNTQVVLVCDKKKVGVTSIARYTPATRSLFNNVRILFYI